MLGSVVPRVWLSRRLLRNLQTWRRKLPNSFRSPFFKHEWLTHSDTWRNKHSCSPLECLARPFQHHRQTSGSPLRPCLQRIVASTGTLHERKAVRGLGQNIFPFLTLQYVLYSISSTFTCLQTDIRLLFHLCDSCLPYCTELRYHTVRAKSN